MTEAQLIERIKLFSRFAPRGKPNVVADTTEFMAIGAGDVIELEGRCYLVRGEEVEGRFGLDGEPKFWVKKAVDLEDGAVKVIKLVFYESFIMRVGQQEVRCFRSPRKESRILDLVRGDSRFMQGFTIPDSAGNPVRILEKIQGVRLYDVINDLAPLGHEAYFHGRFPEIFENVLGCVEAIQRLHEAHEVHGDIRNDHILIERHTGKYRWIDFDYTYEWTENPNGMDLYGLGNVLLFTVGKGFRNVKEFGALGPEEMKVASRIEEEDLSLFFKHRIVNLGKLFPYIPVSLNRVLMRFGRGAEVFYESAGELLDDLYVCKDAMACLQ